MSDDINSTNKANMPMINVVKRQRIKVVVKRRKKPSRKAGLPTSTIILGGKKPNSSSPPSIREPPPLSSKSAPSNDEFPLRDFLPELKDLACDTLLLMRSIEQSQQCLYVPLHSGALIPVVLESQLHSKLVMAEGDSVATQELQDLAKANQIRRLVAASSEEEETSTWIETKHFVRAVWDAHRWYASDSSRPRKEETTHEMDNAILQKVTSWFLSNLKHWTKRSITKEDMKVAWIESGAVTLDQAIDLLVDMQVLLPSSNKRSFLVWLPHWGPVLRAVSKAQSKVVAHIKRSLYKELSVKIIERQTNFPGGLTGSFVLHTLVTQGKIEVVKRPSGGFARMPQG